jgi:uncharacterized protein
MSYAFHIDAFEFCRLKESREGELALSDLPRLAAELADPAGTLHWSLQGGKDAFGHAQMILAVTGDVQLRCQRCLTAMPFSIASESTLVLAPDEASADGIEELLDDEAIDVIVGSTDLDVLALVEDEALLALPLAPRHAVCPEGAALPQEKVAKESPFAVLKNLKQ